jgi:hypothetical protein
MKTEKLVSNIDIVNPRQIKQVHTYPFKEINGDDNAAIVITLVGDTTIYLQFTNKEDAKSSLREIYDSMTHNMPLFVIQHHRDAYGKPITSDKAVIGGTTLSDVQDGFDDMKIK